MSPRLSFLGRRLGFYLIAGWVAVTLNFFVPRAMPGDPVTALFAQFQGNLEPEAIDALKETFGSRTRRYGSTHVVSQTHGDRRFWYSSATFQRQCSKW